MFVFCSCDHHMEGMYHHYPKNLSLQLLVGAPLLEARFHLQLVRLLFPLSRQLQQLPHRLH